jgi:hypothetical protein
MDSVNLQSDNYNIMLASLGTTPLKIIYAGRLEYARVCVCLQVLQGKRDMWKSTQGRPADEFFSMLLKQQTSAKIWRMPDYVLLKTVAICH